ncbi:MAG: hypothetical protein C0594_05695 [Marinilabiliales bacterium]|nr:MAG: hypothetical protein C0594_05695 [Marinilabiliales bacterium]
MEPKVSIAFVIVFIFIAVIELILKGFAMWKSARNNQKGWFIAIFVINTAGILPLVYLLVNRKKK